MYTITKPPVVIAGAGPGDPELLTLKALKALQQAEVVLTDRLVSPDILDHCVHPRAEIIYTGKESRRANSTPQLTINALLVQHWYTGKRVVRLKGGDIGIFGNLLDELETLHLHRIPFELIPGVTASCGAAAYAGIPLTARRHSTAVRIITMHDPEVHDDRYWQELASTGDTLVFYMGGEKTARIAARLVSLGKSPDTPMLQISQATTPMQHVSAMTLGSVTGHDLHFISPCLLIIGEVAALHKQFAWREQYHANERYFLSLTDSPKQLTHVTRA